MAHPPVVLLMGPTASGKTGVAVELAARQAVDLISVDSALVYRDMNIGTAKPDAETLLKAPHALVDIVSPEDSYSAANFVNDATQLIQASHAQGRLPVLVGGTMLYFKALQEGLSDLPVADPALREQLQARAQTEGWAALHAELAQLDPITAARLQPADSQRIERALEVCILSGEPMSTLFARQKNNRPPFNFIPLALIPSDRAVLHERIALRFKQMLQQGLIEEVELLRTNYQLHLDLPSMRCVGYRQTWEYLDGAYDKNELCDRGIFATRQLAKRQLTWLRGMEGVLSYDCLADNLFEQIEEKIKSAARF